MSAYTPGPWELWTSNSWRRITSRATGSTVCEPVAQRDGHPDLFFRNGGENGPDARLLVAAPDLLHAVYVAKGMLARQLDRFGHAPDSWGDDEHEAFAVLKRVIAKVEQSPESVGE